VKIDWKKEIKLPRPSFSWLRRPSLSVKTPSVNRPSIKTPSVKRPSLKGPSLRRPKALRSSPSIKAPRFLADLYADLRDRHLLPLVALLLVAIVAAPILLGGGSDRKQPPVATATITAGGATADSSFTVVPAARGLRSPAKRLGHRHALDPFRAESAAAPESGSLSEVGGTEGPSGGTGSSSAAPEASSPSPESSPAPVESARVEPAAPAGPSSGHSESTTTTTEHVTVENEVVGYTVDMKAGTLPGELTEQTEVEPMTRLPSAKNPVILFVGFSQDNKRALFLMTSKVTAYYGAVQCAVDKQACQMIELKPGHSASFSYGYGESESRYKVVLKKIEPVTQTSKAAAKETVKKTRREHPQARGSSVGTARRFSK
jgi:hypothetical protein